MKYLWLLVVLCGGLLAGYMLGNHTLSRARQAARSGFQARIPEIRKTQGRTWVHRGLNLSIRSVPIPPDYIRHQLLIQRGEDTTKIPVQPEESWQNLVFSPETNVAYVLVQRAREVRTTDGKVGEGYDALRIVRMELPDQRQGLSDVILTDVLDDETLSRNTPDTQLVSLLGMSSNAKYLLVRRSDVVERSVGSTRFTERFAVLNVDAMMYEPFEFSRN